MDFDSRYSRRLWTVIVLSGIGAACAMAAAGLSFKWSSALPGLTILAFLLALAWFYRRWRPEPRIASALDTFAQLMAFSAIGATLSYVAATADRPLWDAAFLSWDRALGLEWPAYLAFVNARPWLAHCYAIAYNSIEFQMFVLLVVLPVSGLVRGANEFVMTFIITALLTILVSALMPASDMYVTFAVRNGQDISNLMNTFVFAHLHDLNALRAGTKDLNALRAGTKHVIDLGKMKGIVTFPSFYAALGLLFVGAFWRSRWLRWPGLLVNAIMIASAPIDGGHYFVDILAGMALAGMCITVVRRLPSQSARHAPGVTPHLPFQRPLQSDTSF